MSDNLDEFCRSIEAFGMQLTGDNLAAMTSAAAEPILAKVIARAPDRTGALKSNIQKVTESGDAYAVTTVEVANSAPGGSEHYAVFEEYGTSKEAARPFMRPAFEAAQDRAIEAFENELQRILES